MTRIQTMDRRDFLKIGATLGGGLILGVSFPCDSRASTVTPGDTPLGAGGFAPNAFVRVGTDGMVTIWLAKADMGQGVRTALPMIVADEMDADWKSVEVVQADADPKKYGRQMTVGSASVRGGAWMALRQAGAAAREMLVAAGAPKLGVPASELRAEAGRVVHPDSGRSLSFGELATAAAGIAVPSDPKLKDPTEFRLIGRSVPLVDTELKVTGKAVYGIDVRVPGLRFATVRKSPILGGSLERLDDTAARAVAGVRDVVRISSGVAVVADNTWAAFEGARVLQCSWSGDFRMSSVDISRHHRQLLEGEGVRAREEGNAADALARSARKLEALYEVPYLAHATMEPMNCTAHVRSDGCEIWAPTQNPQGAQSTAARITGLPIDKVTAHVTYIGCGWGRRSRPDFVEDAVETSMKVGAPVQVVWSREEDIRNDPYRPSSVVSFEGALDADGRLHALRARVAGPPLGITDPGATGRSGVDRNSVDGIASMPYAIPNVRVDYHRSEVQVPTGYWRSVGPSGNCFMIEGFIDEAAHAAGQDPLAYRLAMLEHQPRIRNVLAKVGEMAQWAKGPPAGRGRGIGLVEDKGGITAHVAEVSVDGDRVRVHRVWCAADCGRIIHPGIVEAQLSGSIVAGLTAALYSEITVENGRVVQSNFDDYPLLRMREMPEVEVFLVPSREEPGGVGEPGVPPVAPAVANAVFALTGKRVRKLPIRLG